MGHMRTIALLLLSAFVLDFALHRYVFPLTAPAPVPPKEQPADIKPNVTEALNETAESEAATEEEEDVPAKDEKAAEAPTNATHQLEEDEPVESESKPKPKKKAKNQTRKGNFKYINVHIKLW